jgi:hypothetical protein
MAQHRDRFISTRRVASCAKNVRQLKDRPRRVNRNTSTTAKQPLRSPSQPCAQRLTVRQLVYQASAARFWCHLHSLVPLPKSSGDVTRQPMAELTRQHDDLTPVMALVRDEVR